MLAGAAGLATCFGFGPALAKHDLDVLGCYNLASAQRFFDGRFGGLKTEEDLDHWLECFSPTERLNKKYLEDYKGYIRLAAQEFDIPYQFLTCLLFRESSGWQGTTSPVGAVGFAQLMPQTMEEMAIGLRDRHGDAEMDRLVSRLEADLLAGSVRKKKQTLKSVSYGRDRVFYETLSRDLNSRWAIYFEAINSGRAPSQRVPKTMDPSLASDPRVAIGAAAYQLNQQMHTLERFIYYDRNFGERPESDPARVKLLQPNLRDFWLLVSAGYNWGSNIVVSRYVENPKVTNIDDFLQRSKSGINSETVNHVVSIRNCMETKNWNPPSGSERISCQPPQTETSQSRHQDLSR